MAVALSAGALLLGTMADRLRRHGIGPRNILAGVAGLFIAAQFALLARLPLPSYLLWSVIAAVGAAPVLSYTIRLSSSPRKRRDAPMARSTSSTTAAPLSCSGRPAWSSGDGQASTIRRSPIRSHSDSFLPCR